MESQMASILNIAHRGARSLAPENTLAAARKALEIGADLWETDVAVTADEELVLLHDDSLARTTDVAARFPGRAPWMVTTFALAQVRSLDAGTWYLETDPFGQIAAGKVTPDEQAAFRGEKVPTLREGLAFTQEANWRVNLELKRIPPPMEGFPTAGRVLGLLDEMEIEAHRVIISSFEHDWLRDVQRGNPEIRVQALVRVLGIDCRGTRELEFRTYNAWARMVDEEQIWAAAETGIAVNLYTVNREEDMRRFIAAGVAGLITDFPQRLRAVLRQE
jgi:glycerophosphoryl diester phosphodiesterase